MIGAAEIAIAAAAIVSWRWRPFFTVNLIAMIAALAVVAIQSPAYLVAAFNPVTLNTAMAILSIAGYLSSADMASAARCLRRPPKEAD